MTDQKETRAIVGQLKADYLSLRSGVIGVARTAHTTITNGGAGLVLSSNSAAISRGGAAAMLAGDSMTVTQGGGSIMAAGNSMTVTQGGGQVLIAGSSMTVTQGGGGIMVAGQAKVDRSDPHRLHARDPDHYGRRRACRRGHRAVAGNA